MPVDQATSSFGMIAGGAAGVISISRELGADERLVAVLSTHASCSSSP